MARPWSMRWLACWGLPVALTAAVTGCYSRAPVLNSPGTEQPSEDPPKAPQAEARALYRIAEARFEEGDAVGAAGVLSEALSAMPDDVDAILRHQLEARLTHMQLTAWQSTGDLAMVLAARQRVFSRMAAFPTVVASLTAEQADAMRNELFEQLADVEAQLERHLEAVEGEGDNELAILTAASEAQAPPERERAEAVQSRSGRYRAADGSETRRIKVKTRRQSPFDDDDADAEARFNSAFANAAGHVLTRGPDLLHGPRGLVRVLTAADPAGHGARARARQFVVAHREALVSCYDEAFARVPIFGLQLEVGLTLDGSQVESAALTEGALIDAAGNRCLVDALVAKDGYPDGATLGRATVRLLFFFQEAKYFNPATGESYGGAGPSKTAEPDRVEQQKFAPIGR